MGNLIFKLTHCDFLIIPALLIVMGAGFFKLEILVLLLYVYLRFLRRKFHIKKNNFGVFGLLIGAVLTLFLFFYCYNYIPYKPYLYSIDNNYFLVLIFWVVIAFFVPILAHDEDQLIFLPLYFGLGAFIYSFATMVATFFLIEPPYYTRVIDLRMFLHNQIALGNTPSISSFLTIAAVVSVSAVIFIKRLQISSAIFIVILVLIFATVVSQLIQQRTFLYIFFAQLLVVTCLLVFLKKYQAFLIFISLIGLFSIYIYLNSEFFSQIFLRNNGINIFLDDRFQMFLSWVNQLYQDPNMRPEVGPHPLQNIYWFHNFYADIHRLSGLEALISMVILTILVLARFLYFLVKCPSKGAYLIGIAIPCFLLMNITVVPEGEKQPFLLLILLSSICEVLIFKTKNPSVDRLVVSAKSHESHPQ